LTLEDTQVLVRFMEADPSIAEAAWRDSLGLPAAVIGRIHRHLREQGRNIEPRLTAEARRILEAVQKRGEAFLPDVAADVGMSEHQVLDHAEVLFAEGLLECARNGAALRPVARGTEEAT
jgi:hypothetical protein